MEIGFPAHGRHADAVAIAADPRDDALHQMLHLGVIGSAKAQRVQVGDRPRAHREDIAQDAADAGGRALIGLDIAGVDIAGVVVALHLEDGGLTVANVDHARILARPADHPRGLGRQLLEVEAARLVAAMLRPHHRKDAELDQIWFTPQRVQHAGVFFLGQPVGGDDFGGDFSHGARIAVPGRRCQCQAANGVSFSAAPASASARPSRWPAPLQARRPRCPRSGRAR